MEFIREILESTFSFLLYLRIVLLKQDASLSIFIVVIFFFVEKKSGINESCSQVGDNTIMTISAVIFTNLSLKAVSSQTYQVQKYIY